MTIATTTHVDAKEIKRFFAQQFKQVSNSSPFAIPRTDEIEAALADGATNLWHGVVMECNKAGRIVACALLTHLRGQSRQTDFTQRHGFKMSAGSTLVTHLAIADECSADRLYNFVKELDAMMPPERLVEVYEEREREKQCIDALGALSDPLALSAIKISAYAEIKGLYTSEATGVERAQYEPEELATLETLDSKFLSQHQHANILSELRRYEEQLDSGAFANHYSLYNKKDTWSAFALRGYSPDPSFIIKPSEMTTKWQKQNSHTLLAQCAETEAAEHFRGTLQLLRDMIPGAQQRVRFMKLAAKRGELSRHCDIQDKEAGVADNMIARLHIPLQTSLFVQFIAWDARGARLRKHLNWGGLHYLDVRKPHAAFNNGDFERIHLVVDVHSTEELRKMIRHAATTNKG